MDAGKRSKLGRRTGEGKNGSAVHGCVGIASKNQSDQC